MSAISFTSLKLFLLQFSFIANKSELFLQNTLMYIESTHNTTISQLLLTKSEYESISYNDLSLFEKFDDKVYMITHNILNDYIEELDKKGEPMNSRARRKIPWKELLKDDIEANPTRGFKAFIFPWKENQ